MPTSSLHSCILNMQAANGGLGTLSPWFKQLLPRRLLEDGGRGELAAAVRPVQAPSCTSRIIRHPSDDPWHLAVQWATRLALPSVLRACCGAGEYSFAHKIALETLS